MKRLQENQENVGLTYSRECYDRPSTEGSRGSRVEGRLFSFDADGVYVPVDWVNPADWQQGY